MCADARAGALAEEVPASAGGLELCAVLAYHAATRTAWGVASAAASEIGYMVGEEGDVLGAPGIDGAFACVALTAAGPPAWQEPGCATYVLVEGIYVAVVDACAEPGAGRGAGLPVAA